MSPSNHTELINKCTGKDGCLDQDSIHPEDTESNSSQLNEIIKAQVFKAHYSCESHNEVFVNLNDIDNHPLEREDEPKECNIYFLCPICGKKLKRFNEMEKHKKKEHSDLTWENPLDKYK